MPRIVGYTSNFTGSTSAVNLVIPGPAADLNDLLMAFIAVDTGSGVWSSSGWSVLSARTNTSQLAVLYKVATASEPAEYTFSTTVAETSNGVVVSIKEVNTSTPFGSPSRFAMTTQGAASKYTMPTIETNVANSLIMYATTCSAVGVPSLIEGPVTLIQGQDGSAESLGVGWGYKGPVGTTSAVVTASHVGTGAGVKAVFQVCPPASGATQIPAFCAADASVYINPINGTTAYNTNAALAATFDTQFATTISGTTAADATVAAAADVGINSYHSAGRLTSISASKNWAGLSLDLAVANVVNATGKNILVHTGPSTPGQIQNIGPVAAKKGMIFGMLSTAGNWRMWHVHGQGTPFGYQRDVPLIINSNNTTGLLHSTGTLNAAAVDTFGFAVSGGGVGTTVWDFYSMWALDTTTICGGTSSNPVSIPGIVQAAADGHERKSVVQQGASQAIIYQPIRLGSGGTESIYLDLNATAIEFPRQYDLDRGQVNYCSADGVAGLTYWAGPGDTIKHRNSVISSPSKYHWGFFSASTTADTATYDFSGLQIIGAKPINTKGGVRMIDTTFNGCGTVDANGMYFNECTFTASIDTVALQIGAPWEMECIVNSTFSSNSVGLEITASGTYNFSGITFASNTVDVRNSSAGAVIINSLAGTSISTTENTGGGSITINNSKTLELTGLVTGTEVHVYRTSDDVQLAVDEGVAGTTFTYNYNYLGDVSVYITVLKVGYQWIRYDGQILGTNGITIPVLQQVDRNYRNP